RRRHTSFSRDWSSDVCSSDLLPPRVHSEIITGLWLIIKLHELAIKHIWLASSCNSWALVAIVAFWTFTMGFKVTFVNLPLPFARSEERRVGKECRGRLVCDV